jgi:hypothetical protein
LRNLFGFPANDERFSVGVRFGNHRLHLRLGRLIPVSIAIPGIPRAKPLLAICDGHGRGGRKHPLFPSAQPRGKWIRSCELLPADGYDAIKSALRYCARPPRGDSHNQIMPRHDGDIPPHNEMQSPYNEKTRGHNEILSSHNEEVSGHNERRALRNARNRSHKPQAAFPGSINTPAAAALSGYSKSSGISRPSFAPIRSPAPSASRQSHRHSADWLCLPRR